MARKKSQTPRGTTKLRLSTTEIRKAIKELRRYLDDLRLYDKEGRSKYVKLRKRKSQ